MRQEDDGFECIDERTQHIVKEQQLMQTLNSMAGEQQLLKKELQLKESFRGMLQQEKMQLAEKVVKLEQHAAGLQQTLTRSMEVEKLSQEQLRGLQSTVSGLASLKDTLSGLAKSISQKTDALKTSDRQIVEEVKLSHKDLKEEISGLYQQIIEQKNKQIKSLKAKLEDQKRQSELNETTSSILNKTSGIEEQMKLLVASLDKGSSKDREIAQLRARVSHLEKTLTSRETELQLTSEKQRTLEKEISFKQELIESTNRELANKQLALINSESRLEDAMNLSKILEAELRAEKQLREVIEQREYNSANLSAQVENSFRLVSEKLELVEYQLSRNHELTELFELFEEKITDIIRNTKENNLSFFFENIHDKLVLTLPEQKNILFGIKNDLKEVRDALLGEQQPAAQPQPAAQRKFSDRVYEGHRKKIEQAYDFFDV